MCRNGIFDLTTTPISKLNLLYSQFLGKSRASLPKSEASQARYPRSLEIKTKFYGHTCVSCANKRLDVEQLDNSHSGRSANQTETGS